MNRGTGKTTRQMEAAPNGAVFVWCNQHIDYPVALAQKLGRDDLEIVGPSWLESQAWRGRYLSGLVIDHAARLTDPQRDYLIAVLTRVVPGKIAGAKE